MAPEVIKESVYDHKADIWSLGITVYELIKGNPPYTNLNRIKVLDKIAETKPPRIEGKQHSQSLQNFISSCLVYNPRNRPSAQNLLKMTFVRNYLKYPAKELLNILNNKYDTNSKYNENQSDSCENVDNSMLEVDNAPIREVSRWNFETSRIKLLNYETRPENPQLKSPGFPDSSTKYDTSLDTDLEYIPLVKMFRSRENSTSENSRDTHSDIENSISTNDTTRTKKNHHKSSSLSQLSTYIRAHRYSKSLKEKEEIVNEFRLSLLDTLNIKKGTPLEKTCTNQGYKIAEQLSSNNFDSSSSIVLNKGFKRRSKSVNPIKVRGKKPASKFKKLFPLPSPLKNRKKTMFSDFKTKTDKFSSHQMTKSLSKESVESVKSHHIKIEQIKETMLMFDTSCLESKETMLNQISIFLQKTTTKLNELCDRIDI